MGQISVVMCTYNGARFIEAQLTSILGQTLPPVEIVVSDDGSTDATLDIVRSVAESSVIPIRVHQNTQNLGFADNFLNATTLATGSLIAFSDQDDRWGCEKLRVQHEALLSHDADLCVHPVHLIDSSGDRIAENHRTDDVTRVVTPLQADPWGNFYGFTMLFRKDLLDSIPFQERGLDPHAHHVPLSHDRWVYFLASTLGRTVVLGDRLAEYRQHESQMYGGEHGRTFRERATTKLAIGQGQLRYLTALAAHRAAMLEAGESEHPFTWADGARWWRSIEAHLKNRERIYDDLGPIRRLGILVSGFRGGAYRKFAHGGLGPRRLGEDLIVAILGSSQSSRNIKFRKAPR